MKRMDCYRRPELHAAVLSVGLFWGAPVIARAQVTSYDFFSSGQWFQTSASPGFTANNASEWFAAADINFSNSADALSASLSTGGTHSPFSFTDHGTTLSFNSNTYATRADLEADFPTGTSYTYEILSGAHAGETGTFSVPASPPYPNTIPTFSNFASFSAMNPSSATFQWNSWTLPTTASGEFFDVRNQSGTVVFSTFFTTSQTSFTVPDGVLSPNSNYSAEVIFSSRLDSGLGLWNGAPPTPLGGWDYRTSASFSTVPEPRATALVTAMALAGFVLLRRRWAQA